jgi:hypothetical protein
MPISLEVRKQQQLFPPPFYILLCIFASFFFPTDYHGQFIGAPFFKLVLYGSKTTREAFVVDIDPDSGFPKGPAVPIPVINNGFQPERRNRPALALMHGDPFRLFVFGGWKVDSDPPVASAGLRCLTFRVPVSGMLLVVEGWGVFLNAFLC